MDLKQEISETIKLAWPIALAQFLWFSMTFVDNVIVGHIGVDALASLALGMSYHHWWFTGAIGLLVAVNPLVSQAFGKGDHKQVGRVVRHGLYINFFLSAFVVATYQFAQPILVALGQQEALSRSASLYLGALSWGVPALLGWVVLRQITEATSDPMPSLVIMGLGALLNIPLDYGLVYGVFGLPELGMAGAGYATSFIAWFDVILILIYVKISGRYQKFQFYHRDHFLDRSMLRELMALGIPMAGSLTCELGLFVGATLVMGLFSTLELAAHQVALNLASLVFMIPLGISFAVSIRVGQAAGAGGTQHARQAGSVGFSVGFVMQIFLALVFVMFSEPLASLYTDNQETIQLAANFLLIAALFQLFDGVQVVGMGALRGIKDIKVPFYNNIISYWLLGFAAVGIFAFIMDLRGYGVWLGIVVGLGAAAAAHMRRFYKLTAVSGQSSHIHGSTP